MVWGSPDKCPAYECLVSGGPQEHPYPIRGKFGRLCTNKVYLPNTLAHLASLVTIQDIPNGVCPKNKNKKSTHSC